MKPQLTKTHRVVDIIIYALGFVSIVLVWLTA